MDLPDLLLEFYGRIPPLAEAAVDGLDADQLDLGAGPRGQPDRVAGLAPDPGPGPPRGRAPGDRPDLGGAGRGPKPAVSNPTRPTPATGTTPTTCAR